MAQTFLQAVGTILCIAGATLLTRILPYIIFPEKHKTPKAVLYIGRVLPSAVIGMLVVYCFKAVSFITTPYGLPEIVSILAIAVLHFAFRKTLVSIGGGTFLYILLVNLL